MIALMAAALIAIQPAPLKKVATRSCHGASATAQPTTPTASETAPALVIAGTPKRP